MQDMIHRNTRSLTISNDEIGLQTHPRLIKLFKRAEGHRSQSRATIPSSLYLACQNNDLERVESCMKRMKRKEIDCQYPPLNETALHIATRKQNKEIIKILLFCGAQRSLRNRNGQQAYELAQTKEIKDLFKRPESSRFTFLPNSSNTITLFKRKTKCQTCSLINDNTFYEWELVDRNASQKALRFRRELKPSLLMNGKSLKEKLYSIRKGYINARLEDVTIVDGSRIDDYFKRALIQEDPNYIITAYTICQHFSNILNTDMARNVIHDLKNGCSKFSCNCLYSTEDGTKLITNILLHHPNFEKFSFKGAVYRGIIVPKNTLDHYIVNSRIITTTFLSTSKNPEVAQIFCDKGTRNPSTQSFLCIYQILNNDRTALDISKISEFEDEDEVLILPYSAFLITKIEEGQEITYIYLKEQCLTHIFNTNGLQQYSINSTSRLMDLVESSSLHSTSEILLQEDDRIRPRSRTMPGLDTHF